MESKECKGCATEKDVSEFNKNRSHSDGLQSHCRECNNRASARHYESNKGEYVDRAARRQKETTAYIRACKDVPCSDCGKRFPHYVMDFDHRPGEEKFFNLGDRSIRGHNIEKIKAEIAKCDVVCSNCHRERTWQRAHHTHIPHW